MSIFGLGRKKEEKQTPACGCGSPAQAKEASACCCAAQETACCGDAVRSITSIRVLGAGCKACHEQAENAKSAVRALGLSVEVEYITDMEKVMAYGVMSMPAIVVNEQVVAAGRVLSAGDVEKLLRRLGG